MNFIIFSERFRRLCEITPRTKTHHTRWSGGSRAGEAPRYWNILYNNRPKRRKDKRTCHKILMDELHPDNVAWELGNRKPHEYYW